MKKGYQNGDSDVVGIIILAVLILIAIFSPKHTATTTGSVFSPSYYAPTSAVSGTRVTSSSGNSGNSAYATRIYMDAGDASYTEEADKEYITLNNNSDSPVDITGWQLSNAKANKTYNLNGSLARFSSDSAVIPQGLTIFTPFINFPQDIILNPGDMAIVTTGLVSNTSPYKITSFKENMCTGYLEALPDYSFTPPLNESCPQPSSEPGFQNLDNECKTFVRTMPSCHTPVFNNRTPTNTGVCTDCADGKILTGQCIAFLKAHYNYQGCVANHQSDAGFLGHTWRIFLGRGWELWDTKDETINLTDKLGNLVSSQSY